MSVFHHKLFFTILSTSFNVSFYNEHVEMNKFCVVLASTWMTIIDSQFYIIYSLSFDVSLE